MFFCQVVPQATRKVHYLMKENPGFYSRLKIIFCLKVKYFIALHENELFLSGNKDTT